MDWRLIFFSTYETILSVIFGLVTIFIVIKILDLTILRTKDGGETDSALNKGNVALGLLAGTVIISTLILVQSSIPPAISNLQTMLLGKEITIKIVLLSFGSFLLYYAIALVISIVILFLSIGIYMKATTNIDEVAEIKKNNIAIAIMLSMVIIGTTIFIQPSVSRFIASFVNYNASSQQEKVVKKKGQSVIQKQVAPEGAAITK